MRWEDFRRSDNIEDERDGSSGGGFGGGGGGFGGGGRLGIGTVIVLGLVGWALGIDPSILIGGAEIISGGGSSYQQTQREPSARSGAPTDREGQFVAAVVGNTEDVWKVVFQRSGQTYRPPRLRLFDGTVSSPCGMASSASGPFYCPTNQRIYLDTSFFREMQVKFHGCDGKACEFAQAYVIAHEVGHHIQNQLGVFAKVREAQQASGNRTTANQLQVRVELQADCFAGVWAHNSNQKWKTVEPGDAEAALQTAAAIGDDRLQKQAQGHITPESFTHGSSEQRVRWFRTGLDKGVMQACDTFSAARL